MNEAPWLFWVLLAVHVVWTAFNWWLYVRAKRAHEDAERLVVQGYRVLNEYVRRREGQAS